MYTKKRIQLALNTLHIDGFEHLYSAGLPNYNRNFSRDSFIYGFLANDLEALNDQVAFSALHQGIRSDNITGEEPGKIHHEWPGFEIRGLMTTYNACDTTALFLIAIDHLNRNRPQNQYLKLYEKNINAALYYIKSHLHHDLFWEDSRLSGAEHYALKVTYWKDSVLNGHHSTSHYPIVYSLAHFQNAYALTVIGKSLRNHYLASLGESMIKAGIDQLWHDDHFVTALENNGTVIDPPSTDSLYSLYFLKNNELPRGMAKQIETYSKQLETKFGYRSGIPLTDHKDQYHTRFIWVYEQAILNSAATRHKLRRAKRVSKRIKQYLKHGFAEELDITHGFQEAADPVQLWSIGAAKYFFKT